MDDNFDRAAGAGGRACVVEVACGVLERSISVSPTSKWPADCDKSTSIVRGRYCFCKRLWLEVLAREPALPFRERVDRGGEAERIALILLTDPRRSRVKVGTMVDAFRRELLTSSPIKVRTTLVAGGDSGSGMQSAFPSRSKTSRISRHVSRSFAFSDSTTRSAPRSAAFSSERLESSSSSAATRRRSVATILFAWRIEASWSVFNIRLDGVLEQMGGQRSKHTSSNRA